MMGPTGFRTLLMVALCSRGLLAGTPNNDWLIVPGLRVGPLTSKTTRVDLAGIFGSKNVVDQDVTVGDEGPMPGTVVHGRHPAESLVIIWHEDRFLASIFFCFPQPPTGIRQESCRWHTQEGISFGTSLKQLEKLNGRPFKLLGFGWDEKGTVLSWEGGDLEHALQGRCGELSLHVVPEESREALRGDRLFTSDIAGMQVLNPRVRRMNVGFHECGAADSAQ